MTFHPSLTCRCLIPRVALIALVLAACEPRPPIVTETRDSAGVRVVVSEATSQVLPPALRLSEAPVADLSRGNPGGPPLAYATDAVILPDGGVLVLTADGGVHRYDTSGAYLWSQQANGITLSPGPADSVTILVEPGTVLRVLGPEGNGRELALAWPGAAPLSEVVPADGDWLALTGWSTSMLPPGSEPGLREDPAHLLRFDARGALADTVTTLPGSQVGLVSIGGRVALLPPYFPRVTVAAGRGGTVALGSGAEDAFQILDAHGTLEAVARRTGRDRTLDPAQAAEARAQRQRMMGQNALLQSVAQEVERLLPMPANLPPYVRLLVDSEGRVWAAEYPMPGEPPATWAVYGAGGALLGEVQLPSGFRVLDAAHGRVVGHVGGPADPTVQIYALEPVA